MKKEKEIKQTCTAANNRDQSRSSTNHKWIPPPPGWLKINVDSTYAVDSATSGIISRNEDGSITLAAAHAHKCLDAISAESLAILDVCKIIDELKLKKVIFESDCLNAIALINGVSFNIFWNASPIIEHIKKFWNCWPTWIFKYVPRSSNGAAHNLAKWAVSNSFDGVLACDSIPIVVFCDQGYPLVNT
ncbi:hypothetical protein CASFOL_027569 [Castilleja foliolosa]|uniref:RNase H type-1 domain-containing protein n=1 Tax=Castilleja foliolosa TaxID=1961234 RepID=A0ABD3CF65_9LAMI